MEIESLIDDVLVEIFSLLDESSLINARKVCQRWMNLIDVNPQISTKFIITLNAYNSSKKIPQDLRYQNVRFDNFKETFNSRKEFLIDIKTFIDFNKSHIKNANFFIADWKFFSQNVLKFENLEKLTINCVVTDHNADNVITFPNLKDLEIIDCRNLKILAPKLRKFSHNLEAFWSLIENYPNLTHLTFNYRQEQEELKPIPQKLKFLDVKLNSDVNLLKFLESQRDSINELRLHSINFHQEIEFAVFDMRVDKLSIEIPEKFKSLGRVNRNLKELELTLWRNNLKIEEILLNTEAVLFSCPNIENLTILESCSVLGQVLEIVSKALKNLKHLTLDECFIIEIIDELDLSSIESILILNPIRTDDFVKLLLKCKNLKKIRVDKRLPYNRKGIDDLMRVLTNLKHLEEISAKLAFYLSDEVVNYLIKENLSLRMIKIQVEEVIYERQKELSARLSRNCKIQCTVLKY